MIPAKTSAGLQVLKDRSIPLTQRQRAALIVVDGKRTLADVLQSSGVTREEVERLFELGLVIDDSVAVAATVPAPLGAAAPTAQQRYSAAYPIATKLTASLGLRGVRLNLAVEAASSYEDLVALSVKIRDAVGVDKFAPLAAALAQK
jgi:hypothetical protein